MGQHHTPASGHVSLVNDRDAIDALEDLVVDLAEQFEYARNARFALRLALEEAIVNAFRHGHAHLPHDTPVEIDYSVGPEEIRVEVEDQGPGFTPSDVPDPTLDENLERPSGRGLVLMRAYMTRIRHLGRGNRVEMLLKRPESLGEAS